jgi:hypothetical protein
MAIGGRILTADVFAAASTDTLETILKAIQTQQAARAFRARVVTITNGITHELAIEYAPPDRFRLHQKDGKSENIWVGGDLYNIVGGHAVKNPMSATIKPMIDAIRALPTEVSDFKEIGRETIEGTPATVYEFMAAAKIDNQTLHNKNKLWVRLSDGLPIKRQVDGESAGVRYTTTHTITYDPSIKIELPR